MTEEPILLWPGRPPAPIDGGYLWTDVSGEPCVTEIGGQPYAIASTTVSQDSADAPDGAVAVHAADRAGLLAEVPGGFGLVIDAATAHKRLLSAEQVDGFRGAQPPCGDESDLWLRPAPRHLEPMLTEARTQARAAGARGVAAFWARLPNGPAGLLIDVVGQGKNQAPPEALHEVMECVRRHAPQERARVVCSASFPDGGQGFRLAQLKSSGIPMAQGCLPGSALVTACVTALVIAAAVAAIRGLR
jgi:hypothetical protein